jgi:tetratricopeptide (TPR) repeat protein
MTEAKRSNAPDRAGLDKIKFEWQNGNRQHAVNLCQTLLRNNPQHAPTHAMYANFLEDAGNIQEAAKHYQAACGLPDTTPDCFLAFAQFLKKLRQSQNAEEVLSVGHKKWPKHALMARELGVVLGENDHHFEAIEAFEACLKLAPDDWICWNHLGCSRALNSHSDEALACFDKSLLLAPKAHGAVATKSDLESIELNKASAFIHAGKTDDACQLLEKVLAANPENHRAWFDLANLIKCDSDQIEQMEKSLRIAKLTGNQDAMRDLHFALGRCWDNAKAPEKAMTHLDAGNRIVRATLRYDSAEVCRRIRRTPEYFPAEMFTDLPERATSSKLRYRPIFIVGMPRCGSTLTEQILASHTRVVGAGEMMTLPTIKKKLLGSDFGSRDEHRDLARAPEIAAEMRDAYLSEMERIAVDLRPDLDPAEGEILVVDKMLGNFDMIGMILRAIPEARIIHCRRNRVDTCLSCYSKLFRSPVSYSYDQVELAEFYLAYEEQMTYWHQHIPECSLLESKYEDMVADTEAQARKLLDFVGLPWDADVLNFHKKKRSVSTASMAQVRKPIYSSSVERWKPYEPFIQPLLNTLRTR